MLKVLYQEIGTKYGQKQHKRIKIQYILATLITTHITILCVTIYLHRTQAHKSLILSPFVSHPMRFWLWLTTGMVTKEWVAIHRRHHSHCEKPGDPHSPYVFGIWRVLFGGAFLYANATKDKNLINTYGVGTPSDWMEHNIYSPHSRLGIGLFFLLLVSLFGWIGIIMWGIQMIWIPFWAAGVINGLGHWFGYRNTDTKDNSRNIFPIGLIIGGEELHNNHHHKPGSPKLSEKWFEIDIAWFWIKLLSHLRLIKIRDNNDK